MTITMKTRDDSEPSAAKKFYKTYAVSIVMQRISFNDLENIVKYINARYKELNSSLNKRAKGREGEGDDVICFDSPWLSQYNW